MSLGLYHQRDLARRHRRWLFVKWLVAIAILVMLGAISYRTGADLAAREAGHLRQQVDELTRGIADLQTRDAQLQAEAATARQREAEWRQRYETDVPKGPSSELFVLVQKQLAKGADPARLALLIGAAAKARSCDGDPKTKRFLIRTPISSGANDAVSFADNAITVTAEGAAATDANGKPEAWFDAAKPVTLRFTEPGGATSETTGTLPLHHAMVRGDKEYRFSIVAAETRGFVIVTAERCAFP